MGDLTNIKHKGKYIVGAYATSPNLFKWEEDSEKQYFNQLKKLSSIRGLELPFWGDSIHPFDDNWLLENIEPSWVNVLTCVPGTMKSMESDSNFGLASKSEKGRKNAVQFYERALAAVRQLNDHIGKDAILSVHITSSPSNSKNNITGSAEKFFESLLEIASWDWCGARVVVEHCDAYSGRFIPQKGFLSLNDEIDAVTKANEKTNLNTGITLNWARSVIEKRSVTGAVEHILEVSKAGILSGMMFSGVTDKIDSPYGPWKDLHMPPCKATDMEYYEEGSLMTAQNMKESLMACALTMLDYVGIKLLALPDTSSIERRVGLNKDAMKLLDGILSKISG